MLNFIIQYVIVALLIGASVLYVGLRLRKLFFSPSESACGGCDGCSEKEDNQSDLLQISVTQEPKRNV